MQRVSYEDSGIITDTRGQTTGTVTIQSANDAPCHVSVPDGTVSAVGGTFNNLYTKTTRIDSVFSTAPGGTVNIDLGFQKGSSSLYVCRQSTGTPTYRLQLGIAEDQQVLHVLKPFAAGSVSLIYTGSQKINGGTSSVADLLSAAAGNLFLIYRSVDSGAPDGWWCATS